MAPTRSTARLAEVAHLYYVQGMTQQEIAKSLDTTRSNVSRILQAAREQGVVRFHIVRTLHRQSALEQAMVESFGLEQAIVLAADAGDDTLQQVAELGAQWLTENLHAGTRLTLSWGRTLQALVQAFEPNEALDVEVVQLGGDLQLDPRLSGHELVRELAARCGGRYSYLHAPAILDSADTVRELRSHRGIEMELNKARTADIALVGIGAYGHGFAAQLLESAHLSQQERARFDELEPVGDILARFYDIEGRQLDTPLRDRVLALELDELDELPTVVGIAAGREKARGIWGALRAGWLDVLVTDQAAAAAALHMENRRLAEA